MKIYSFRRASFKLFIILIVLFSVTSQAQFRDWSTKFGVRGSYPLNAEDDIVKKEPVKINVPIVLEGITFAKNKADITPESEVVLQGALNTMQTYGDIIVEISGHTDSDGSSDFVQGVFVNFKFSAL